MCELSKKVAELETENERLKEARNLKASDGQYVIVRTREAGVHAGIITRKKGDEVTLRDSRRLWRWWSRFTLSELSQEGVRQDKISECKFAVPLAAEIDIRPWCEILPCTSAAEKSIREVPNANK